jgi:putative PEP-CTERM system histidine kinase
VLDFPISGPGAASYGLATLAFAAFAVYLGVGRRGGRAVLLLTAVCLSGLWAALNLAYAFAQAPAVALALAPSDALRMGSWLLFALVLLGVRRRLAAGAAAMLALFAAGVAAAPQAAIVLFLAFAIAGLVLTEQVFRRTREHSRWSMKPLCLGLGGSFVFDLYFYADALLFGRVDADLWAARGLAQALVLPFIAVAAVRNKAWTLDITLSRGVVFHSTAFLASGLYLLAVAGAGYYVRYFGGGWGKTFQVGFVFAALLLLGWLFSSGALRARLRVFINKHFFSYRYDYRQEWLRFTSLLAGRDPAVSAAQRSIEALANLVESPAGALWLRNAEGSFAQAARWNLPQRSEQLGAADPLPRFLERTGWVVDLAQYRAEAGRYPGLELPAWLAALPAAWLIVPIIAQEELIGFVVLATPRTPIEVNWEVLDLLKTAARQVASFLAQLQASEALLEARKFESFNKMSAFVVHDLKNLVAQLSLLLANAERHRHNPRFQDDMVTTVKHVVERMNKLLLQLSTGSRADERLCPVDLAKLAARIVQAKAAERPDIAVEGRTPVITLAHEQRLERVLGHLVQNAIDATRTKGSVTVRALTEGERAIVEVADTGCGMSEEFVRERLYRPFQTTKPAGMGIGAFETAQYVKEMGGSLETDSRPDFGTRIRVILPLQRDALTQDGRVQEAA